MKKLLYLINAALIIFMLAALQLSAQPATQDTSSDKKHGFGPFSFDGYFWVDPTYQDSFNGGSGGGEFGNASFKGRLVLGVNFIKEHNNYYVKARAELLSHVDEKEGIIDTLDSYLQVGNKYWDIQVGRFLAWEAYHKGQGLELYTDEDEGASGAPNIYEVDSTRGHADDTIGQAAVHGYLFQESDLMKLKFEIASVYGQASGQNSYGVRPLVDFTIWQFQIVGAMEYRNDKANQTGITTKSETIGYGGRIQYNSKLITAGVNFAKRKEEGYDSFAAFKTSTLTSFGGFIDIDFWKNSIGLGCHYSTYDDNDGKNQTHLQPFVSYLYRLPFKGLSIKLVLAGAWADFEDPGTDWTADMYSARIRIRYNFL